MYQPGDLINLQYEVRQRLSGGMAYVYIVFDQVSERLLAVKTLRDELLEVPEAAARFEREARTWINLGVHDHVVHALAFLRGKTPLLILEYIDGMSLQRLLRCEPTGLALRQAVRFAWQLARGLAYAHQCPMPGGGRGIVHRDLKPGNVMIDRRSVAKLTDFGLALAQMESQLTDSHFTLGTLPYMPPEQWQSAHTVTEKADLFAFGAVLYEMLTGVRAFHAKTPAELMYQVHHLEPEPIAAYRPDVDPALVAIVDACLRKDPDARAASAGWLVEQLEPLRQSAPQAGDSGLVCRRCGYLPNKLYRECPVCDAELAEHPAPPVEETWTCRCGQNLPRRYRFCIYCGQDFQALGLCRACGRTGASHYRFCIHCGAALLG